MVRVACAPSLALSLACVARLTGGGLSQNGPRRTVLHHTLLRSGVEPPGLGRAGIKCRAAGFAAFKRKNRRVIRHCGSSHAPARTHARGRISGGSFDERPEGHLQRSLSCSEKLDCRVSYRTDQKLSSVRAFDYSSGIRLSPTTR